MMKAKKLNRLGFTIVELMIATSIFSIVLLICSATMLGVARYFQKGVTTNSTQEATRNIVDEISGVVRFDGSSTITQTAASASGARGVYCIGDTRFSFLINSEVSDSPSASNSSYHALWRDSLNGNTCTALDLTKADPDQGNSLGINGRELLPANMRVVSFSIQQVFGQQLLWIVKLRVMAGDNSGMNPQPMGLNLPTGCISTVLGGQFCADSTISESVQERINAP